VEKVVRNDKVLAVLDVDSPPPPEIHAVPTTPSASIPNIDGWASDLPVTENWDTPAFLRTKRLSSGSPLQADFGPFVEEDGFIPGKGRKRPRFSFPSSGWRLVDEPDIDEPTNEDNWFESDEEELQRDDNDVPISGEPFPEDLRDPDNSSHLSPVDAYETASARPLETSREPQSLDLTPTPTPAVLPDKLDTKPISIQIQDPDEEILSRELLSKHPPLPTDTPRLHPLPSPGLATPSPITYTPENSFGYFFQAPPPPRSSQFLAPTTANDQKIDNPPTSSYPFGDTVSPDVSETTHYDNEAPRSGEPDIESRSQFENFSARSGFNSTTQGKHDTVFQAPPEFTIPPFIAESNDHLTTEAEGSLPIDPSISQLHEDYAHEQQETFDHDMEMDGEHAESLNCRYKNVLDHGTEIEVEHIDNMELPRQSQLDWNGRDAGDSSHTFQERIDEDIDSEKIEEERYAQILNTDEHEPVGNGAYNVPAEEYQMVSDGMEEEEPDNDEREDEAEEDDEEMSEDLEDNIVSDSEPDDEVYHNPPQPSNPHRNVYPEVIVLDSDSEDEPPRPEQQPSPQYDDVSDYERSDVSAQAHEYAEYTSVEESDDEVADQKEVISEASSENDQNEDSDDDNSVDEVAENKILDQGSIVDDESARAEDEQLGLPVQDEEALVQENDTGSYRSRSKEPYEASLYSDQSSIRSMPKEISSGSENEYTPGHEYAKDGAVSSGRSPSPGITPRPVSPNRIKLIHETQPLATRTRPLPTPQPTQDEEQYPVPIGPSTDTLNENESSNTGQVSDKGQDLDKASLHQWTDGSGDEAHSPKPDTSAQVPEIRVDGHSLEDDAAPNNRDDDHDEVVLVGGHSTPKSVESEVYVEATEEPLEHEPRTPSPQNDKASRHPLVELGNRLDTVVDIIAIVVEVSAVGRAMSGSKEFYLCLRITDATMAGTTVAVHIFNPDRTSLPVVSEGDAIALRKFKIQSFDHSTAALSGDSSAWAVFHAEENKATIAGPPVELSGDEYEYVQELRSWYHKGGSAMAADHMLQALIGHEQKEHSPSSVTSSDVGSLGSVPAGSSSQRRPRRRKSHRRITIHELRDGRRYTEAGSPGGNDPLSIHELRDGTVYAHSFDRD
jgi:hypothetical protein